MELIRKNWWILALQGLLFMAIGGLVIFSAGFTLKNLITYLGLILLVFGLVMFFWGWRARKTHSNWWGLSFFGVLQLIVGVLILSDPGRATSIFSFSIGGWAILMGISQFVMGFGRKNNRVLFFLNGAVSIVLGVLIIYNPFESENAMTYLVGFYSLLLGLFVIYYSYKGRNFARSLKERHSQGDEKANLKEKNSQPEN